MFPYLTISVYRIQTEIGRAISMWKSRLFEYRYPNVSITEKTILFES